MKKRFYVKAHSTSGWIYLDKTYKTAEYAIDVARKYSKTWSCKTKVVFFEISPTGVKELDSLTASNG